VSIVSFASPWALLLLIPLFAGVAWWLLRERRGTRRAAVPFADLDLVAFAAPKRRWTRWLPGTLLVLALTAFTVALARPESVTSVPREEGTIMLAIDVSGSMAADDVSPYRLRAAQDAAKTFAERVPRQFQVGLVAFNGQADVLLPPSTDREAFKRSVDSLVADGATASGEAIISSVEAIRSTQPGAEKLRSARVLLLSDGANTVGTMPQDAAQVAKDAGVPVYTVALGTAEGVLPDGRAVPPDPASLAAVAEITGGEAFESKDAESVNRVYEDLGTFIGTKQVMSEVTSWPIGIAALLLVLVGSAVAIRIMWSPTAAIYFRATAKQADRMVGWMYLSPNLVGFLAFFAFPLAFSLVISFFDWDGLTNPTFVGLENYGATLVDPLFHQSLTNIFWFMVLAVPLSVASALILAVLIHTNYPGVKMFRAVFFVPSVAGVIGVTLIWKRLFNAQTGTINWVLGTWGEWINSVLPGDPLPQQVEIGWLSDPSAPFGLPDYWWMPSVALMTVVIVFSWAQFGFNTVLFSAGLQSISKELYEAAELDGANAWQRFRNVTLPSLSSTTFFVTATTVILCLQLFDIVYALNQPNPVGFPNNATLTPVVYLYQLGFQQNAFGLASAVAWVLFILIFFFTLAQFRRQRAEVEN